MNETETSIEPVGASAPLCEQLHQFREFGTATRRMETHATLCTGEHITVPTYINEFWTSKQRQASSLHEVSYRACFKPQLPRFFIQRLTQPGDVVYDPFMGRGTTVIEAALLGRIPVGNDINPLSLVFTAPRLLPPNMASIQSRLREITWTCPTDAGSSGSFRPTTAAGISRPTPTATSGTATCCWPCWTPTTHWNWR